MGVKPTFERTFRSDACIDLREVHGTVIKCGMWVSDSLHQQVEGYVVRVPTRQVLEGMREWSYGSTRPVGEPHVEVVVLTGK